VRRSEDERSEKVEHFSVRVGREEEPEGEGGGAEGAEDDPGVLQELFGLESGGFLLHGVVEVDEDGSDDDGGDEDEVIELRIDGHGDAGAEAEEVGVTDHREDEAFFGVGFEGPAVTAGEFGIGDEAEFGVAFAGHEEGAEEPPGEDDGERGYVVGVDEGIVAEPEADGVVEGLGDDIGEGAVLESEGRDIVDNAAQEEEEEGGVVAPVEVPGPGECEGGDDEEGLDGPEDGNADLAGGNAAMAFGWMHGIKRRVEDFVEDVIGRGDEAGGDEGEDGEAGEVPVEFEVEDERPRDDMAEDDEDVFEPVIRAADFDVLDHEGRMQVNVGGAGVNSGSAGCGLGRGAV